MLVSIILTAAVFIQGSVLPKGRFSNDEDPMKCAERAYTMPSPDGSDTAFICRSDGRVDIWISASGLLRNITSGLPESLCLFPDWSPDRNRLLFFSYDPESLPYSRREGEIWIYDLRNAGTEKVEVELSRGEKLRVRAPFWISEETIAFLGCNEPSGRNFDLYSYDLTAHRLEVLDRNPPHFRWGDAGSSHFLSEAPLSGPENLRVIEVALGLNREQRFQMDSILKAEKRKLHLIKARTDSIMRDRSLTEEEKRRLIMEFLEKEGDYEGIRRSTTDGLERLLGPRKFDLFRDVVESLWFLQMAVPALEIRR